MANARMDGETMKFLLNGILCREIFRYVGTTHEERGGCYNFANREVTECDDCEYRANCPADGDE